MHLIATIWRKIIFRNGSTRRAGTPQDQAVPLCVALADMFYGIFSGAVAGAVAGALTLPSGQAIFEDDSVAPLIAALLGCGGGAAVGAACSGVAGFFGVTAGMEAALKAFENGRESDNDRQSGRENTQNILGALRFILAFSLFGGAAALPAAWIGDLPNELALVLEGLIGGAACGGVAVTLKIVCGCLPSVGNPR